MTDLHETIGKRLKIARIIAEKTMQQVADESGVTKQMVQRYEAGSPMNSTRMIALADAVGVNPGYFFRGELSPEDLDHDGDILTINGRHYRLYRVGSMAVDGAQDER